MNDNEVKGEGNQQDYGMRVYDPRIGRFLSVDPIIAEYPMLTPYQFAGNKPITSLDLDGLEDYDFRGAKVNKLNYTNIKWYQDPLGIFGSNSIRSAWNQGVDAAQLDANFLSNPQGTVNGMKKQMISAVFKGIRWLADTNDDEKVDFARKELTNVNNYEDIVGAFILGKVSASIKLPNLKVVSEADGLESIFRVQGGGSKIRFVVGDNSISIQGNDMLFINVGQEARALEFWAKRGEDAVLLKFKVNKSFVDKLQSEAVPQRLGRLNPTKPQIVDPTKAIKQFGVPRNYFEGLLNNIDIKSIEVIKKE